jgi:hypothetical protein
MVDPHFQLAQINIARILAPMDDPIMADFVANLDRINALADAAPGFVWRLQASDGNATSLRPYDDTIIVNMSVWTDPDALHEYVFRTQHVEIMRQRKQWFSKFEGAYTCLWWVPTGHIPTVEEAKERLEHLRTQGDSAYAFSFRKLFPQPVDEVNGDGPNPGKLNTDPANVDKRNSLDEEVFAYRVNKDGKVFITWHGKQVMILKEQGAKKFLAKVNGADQRQAQLVMAKITGNFKHGNER